MQNTSTIMWPLRKKKPFSFLNIPTKKTPQFLTPSFFRSICANLHTRGSIEVLLDNDEKKQEKNCSYILDKTTHQKLLSIIISEETRTRKNKILKVCLLIYFALPFSSYDRPLSTGSIVIVTLRFLKFSCNLYFIAFVVALEKSDNVASGMMKKRTRKRKQMFALHL